MKDEENIEHGEESAVMLFTADRTAPIDLSSDSRDIPSSSGTRAALPVEPFTVHRPGPIRLPDDPALATAAVLALVRGESGIDRASAIEALRIRTEQLSDADPVEAINGLAGHVCILDALFLLFSAESVTSKSPDASARFLKLALQAQSSCARTQALIVGLRAQKEGRAKVTVTDADTVSS